MTDAAFYIRTDEDVFESTERTIGPWGRTAQHGGPPAALLGTAIQTAGLPDQQVSRITFDILKPVPIEPLRVATTIRRPGKRVQLIDASLSTEGGEVMTASAWLIRRDDVGAEASIPTFPTPAPPAEGDAVPVFETGGIDDYLHSMEIRFVAGSFLQTGPATAWFRVRFPLIAGEEITSLARVLVAVDSASGISSELDFTEWLFINPELTVHLNREPRGEWVCLDAETTVAEHGIATSRCSLFDEHGSIGTGAQSLLVAPR